MQQPKCYAFHKLTERSFALGAIKPDNEKEEKKLKTKGLVAKDFCFTERGAVINWRHWV